MAVPGLDPGINPAIHVFKSWMPGTVAGHDGLIGAVPPAQGSCAAAVTARSAVAGSPAAASAAVSRSASACASLLVL